MRPDDRQIRNSKRVSAIQLFAALLNKEPIHNILSETEIRVFQAVEGFGEIEKMALRRPASNAQLSR